MNCEWLKKLEGSVNELLNKDWATEINDRTNALAINDNYEENSDLFNSVLPIYFKIKIKEFEKQVLIGYFEFLNLSIVAGECFHKDFPQTIDKVISLSGNLQYSEINNNSNENLRLSLENVIKEVDPFSILRKCLVEYKSNSRFLQRLVENPSLHTLFDMSDQTLDILEELNFNGTDNDIQKKLLSLTKNNLLLLRKDFTLNYNIDDLRSLLVCKNELSICEKFFQTLPDSLLPELIKILKEKSTFLIRKFIIRKNMEDNIHNENYVFLGVEIDFSLESHILKTDIFKSWDAYSITHFLSEDNLLQRNPLKREAKKILQLGAFKALDYHRLTKYYKDFQNNIHQLKDNLKGCENIPLANYVFDKYSLEIIKNYISNNIFSESLRQISFSTDINEITRLVEQDLKEIQTLQATSQIDNFFPFYKICSFLKEYINKKIEGNDVENNSIKINDIKRALEFLKEHFQNFKNTLKWSKTHLNYAYQLPYNECMQKHKIGEIEFNIFCSSTFSLPIDYKKYDDFSPELEAFFLRIENEIKSIEKISHLMVLYKVQKNQLHNEIKDNTKKNIELLGIFSAVIALVFGGISTATNEKSTFEQQFLILVTLFIILFSFITLLRSFIYKEKEWYSVLAYFLIYIIFLIVIIILLSLVIKIS